MKFSRRTIVRERARKVSVYDDPLRSKPVFGRAERFLSHPNGSRRGVIEFLSAFDVSALVYVADEPSGERIDLANPFHVRFGIEVIEVPDRIDEKVDVRRNLIEELIDRGDRSDRDDSIAVYTDEVRMRGELFFTSFRKRIDRRALRRSEARRYAKHLCTLPASTAARDENDRAERNAAAEGLVPIDAARETIHFFGFHRREPAALSEDRGRERSARFRGFTRGAGRKLSAVSVVADDALEHPGVV